MKLEQLDGLCTSSLVFQEENTPRDPPQTLACASVDDLGALALLGVVPLPLIDGSKVKQQTKDAEQGKANHCSFKCIVVEFSPASSHLLTTSTTPRRIQRP